MKALQDINKATKLVSKVLRRRRAYRAYLAARQSRGPLFPQRFTIGVYFSDSSVNAYQMRQWYEPLRVLNEIHPVVIIARNPEGAQFLIEESGLEVVFAPKVKHLEQLIEQQPLKVLFYVNQNTKNFQMLRYGERWHVFINHGESDKMYMTTNQFKAYDYAFIAGQAARERLHHHVWGYDVDQRTFEIGRPQIDFMRNPAPYPSDTRTVVLYAPTWEGDRPAAAYGSIISHGETLTQQVLSSPNHRLIYRPHPRSGVVDSEYLAAHKRIVQRINEANSKDPSAHHIYDEAAELNWQLTTPDLAICDISAMIYDRLATGKAVMVTKPASPDAEIDAQGYLQECEWLEVQECANILPTIDSLVREEETLTRLKQWSHHYFGDTSHGAPTQRFLDAVEQVLEQWETADEAMRNRQKEITENITKN